MSPTDQLTQFAQDVYLTIKNRFFDEITSEDGQTYLQQVCRWTNMFLDELENTVGPDGQLVDWWFARSSGATLGTAVEGNNSITLGTTIDHLLTDEGRYVQVTQDGIVVSNWLVVHPKDITNRSDRVTEDMCAVVGGTLVFSRSFRDTESNGVIIGDVVTKLPRFAYTLDSNGNVVANNVKLLTTVRPQQLLQFGVAKNATLPDIVQGKLSPSYVQKYNDLLTGAIARSNASSVAATAERENFSHIRGV